MLFRLLRSYLRPYRGLIVAVVVLQMISAAAQLFLPSVNGSVIDKGIARGDTSFILTSGAVMLGISALQIVVSLSAVYLGAKIAMSCGRDLRGAVFHHVHQLGAREVGKLGAPSLITRTTNDVQQVQMLVMMCATLFVLAPIICVGGIVMAVHEDVQLSKLLLVCIPALAGSIGLIIGRMVPTFRTMQPKIDVLNRILREQITGMRVVRAFVREPVEAARFAAANDELVALGLRIGRLQALMWPAVMVVFNVSSVAVLWFGAERVAAESLQVGSLMAYLSYLLLILMSVMLTTFLTVLIPRAAACAERIVEVLELSPEVVSPASPSAPREKTGVVELRDVEYRYPGAVSPVLSSISFTARPGEVTAIIGSTGAGKTTLLDLITRLSDPTSGTVLIDGVDIKTRDLEELWTRIAMVPQRAYLFAGTVGSNIKFGNPDASDDQIWDALAVAQAKDFVEAMPQRLDNAIAQGGTNVSGGQRQRLAIARALVRPDFTRGIYIFDDTFSALDVATEARLRIALRARTKEATVIVVAQRVASITDADRIIVLDAGKVVGQGTHDELLGTCPTYAEILASQTQAAQEAA